MDRLLIIFLGLGGLGVLAYMYLLPEQPGLTYWVYGLLILSCCLVLIRLMEIVMGRLWQRAATPERKKQVQDLVGNISKAAAYVAEDGATNAQAQAIRVTNGVALPSAKYLFGFDGVASRLEYFLAQLFSGTAILVLLAIIMISESESTVLISFLLLIAASLVQLAFGFRRTRDIGVNQWWFLLVLVPPVNLAVLVALFVIPTDEFKGKGF